MASRLENSPSSKPPPQTFPSRTKFPGPSNFPIVTALGVDDFAKPLGSTFAGMVVSGFPWLSGSSNSFTTATTKLPQNFATTTHFPNPQHIYFPNPWPQNNFVRSSYTARTRRNHHPQPDPGVRFIMKPPHGFLGLMHNLGKTLLNGLLVVADVVDGGGDFPVKRTADVEESQEEEHRYYNAECDSSRRRSHLFFRLIVFFFE